VALVDLVEWRCLLGIGSATSVASADSGLSGAVVTFEVDAQARFWGRLVVVLLGGLRLLGGDIGIGWPLRTDRP